MNELKPPKPIPQHSATSYGNERNAPRLPVHGTKNWELLTQGPQHFRPRHSHATCVFKCPNTTTGELCLWLTGGYSESHRTFDLEMEHENSDVWWSRDGSSWNQVMELRGDFLQGVGNWDAKVGGYTAPWYSRYGHSLTALDGDGDGIADVMVLAGGFNPIASNDVWITKDGFVWDFDGYAPWPKRAYHGATVFQGNLWIMGGTPLVNDVWMGRLVRESSHGAGHKVAWSAKLLPYKAPWAPRAGLCAVSQLRQNLQLDPATNISISTFKEQIYILGGFAGFQHGHPRHSDGARARNDVWTSPDGISWERVFPPNGGTMPWLGRAFHSCTTWHSLTNRSKWVSLDSLRHLNEKMALKPENNTQSRIFITGGGYMGRKGNNEVRSLETYTDTWWSNDGSKWTRVNYEEGFKYEHNLHSTNEWTETTVEGKTVYYGKWGHTLEAFHQELDLDKDGEVSDLEVTVKVCNSSDAGAPICRKMTVVENETPALFVIGGKLESGPMVNDVFISKQGIHCEIEGITCSSRGVCGPGTIGCICHSTNFTGDYCEHNIETPQTSSACRDSGAMYGIVLILVIQISRALTR